MPRLRFLILAIAIFASPWPAAAASRVALVIGNGAYKNVVPLPNPPRDAEDIAQSLKRLGYSVDFVRDATHASAKEALTRFGEAAAESDISVVYYAGHGAEAYGENWLIPVDAKIEDGSSFATATMNLKLVLAEVANAKTLGVVILDACRDNPFAGMAVADSGSPAADRGTKKGRSRSLGRGLAPTNPATNVLVAFAAKDGTVASDGDGRNSPFTAALLRNIVRPGLEVSNLFRAVRDEVVAGTNGVQQPYVYGSLPERPIYLGPLLDDARQTRDLFSFAANPLFKPSDQAAVERVISQHQFVPPMFRIAALNDDVPASLHRFVGVWASKVGMGGVGRQIMMIVTNVDADGLASGFYVYGPPTSKSWDQNPPNSVAFTSHIQNDVLAFRVGSSTGPVNNTKVGWIKLRTDNSMFIQTQNGEGKTTSTTLLPVWNLAEREKAKRG